MNVKTFFFLLSLLVTTVCKSQIDTTSYQSRVLAGPNVTLLHDTSGLLTIIGFAPGDSAVIKPTLITKVYTKGTVVYKYDNDLIIEDVTVTFYLYDNGSYEALFLVPVPGSLNESHFLTEKDILKFKQHDNSR